MTFELLVRGKKWWDEHILSLENATQEPEAKVAKVKVKVKSKKHKAIIKTLNGPFGRMDHPNDDVQ